MWWQHGKKRCTLLSCSFVYCNWHVAIHSLFIAGSTWHMYCSSPRLSFILYVGKMWVPHVFFVLSASFIIFWYAFEITRWCDVGKKVASSFVLFMRWKGIQERPRSHILGALVWYLDRYKNLLWHMFEVCMWWKWQCKWRCCGTLEEMPAQSTARLCARTYHWMQVRWDCALICCWEEPLTWREDHVMVENMSQERHNCIPLLCVAARS